MILVADMCVACLEWLVLVCISLGLPRHAGGLGCLELWQMVLLVLLALFSMFSLRLVVLEGRHIGHLAGPPLVLMSESQVSVSVMVESCLHQWLACCVETILEGA